MRLPKVFKTWIGLVMLAAVSPMASSHEAGHDMGHGHDMNAMWKMMLQGKPLAVSAAFDSNGRLWRASVSNGYLQVDYSDDHGKSFSTPVQINREPEAISAEGENRPKIFVMPEGKIFVSYTQSLEKPFSGNVRFSRSRNGGKTFSAPVTINDNQEVIGHRFDSMVVTPQGKIYVIWIDKRDAATAKRNGQKFEGGSIYYGLYDEKTDRFTSNIKIAEHSCECCRLATALDDDDVPVVVWRQIFGKSTRDHALMHLDGKSPLIRASYDNWEINACPHQGPSLSISQDGRYHLVWFSGSPSHDGLFYEYSDDKGNHFSAPFHFGNDNAQASHPYVLSSGRQVYVVWKEFDGEKTVIMGMTSSNGGNGWSSPRVLASTKGASDHPLLVADKLGAYLSWNTQDQGYRLIKIPTGNDTR